MTKAEYLAQFSRIVRWKLSYQEAEEVIDDYEELFAESGRTEAEVCEGLGSPAAAAQALSDNLSYGRWLIAFGIQIFSLAVPLLPLLSFIIYIDVPSNTMFLISGAGLAVSFIWFRRSREYRDGRIPKNIIFSLWGVVFLAGLIGVSSGYWLNRLMQNQISPSTAAFWLNSITGAGILAALAGGISVVKSRMCDRRWQAVYILALTVLLLCTFFCNLLVSLDLTYSAMYFLMEELKLYAVLGTIGILAAGVSLC